MTRASASLISLLGPFGFFMAGGVLFAVLLGIGEGVDSASWLAELCQIAGFTSFIAGLVAGFWVRVRYAGWYVADKGQPLAWRWVSLLGIWGWIGLWAMTDRTNTAQERLVIWPPATPATPAVPRWKVALVVGLVIGVTFLIGGVEALIDHREKARTALLASGTAALNAGEYEKARRLYGQALQQAERAWPAAKVDEIAALVNNRALADWYLGHSVSARDGYERALALRRAEQPRHHAELAVVLVNYAELQAGTGDYAKALLLVNEAVALRARVYGHDSYEASEGLVTKGEILERMGDSEGADESIRRAHTVRLRHLQADDLRLAESAMALGMLLLRREQAVEALPFLEQALAVSQANLGPEHVRVGTAYSNLSCVKSALGRHADAIADGRKAVEILTATFGPRAVKVANAQANLANALAAAGVLEEADSAYKDAVTMLGSGEPGDPLDTADIYENWAYLEWQLGENRAALELELMALKGLAQLLGPEHPRSERAYTGCENLAETEDDLGRCVRARLQDAEGARDTAQ